MNPQEFSATIRKKYPGSYDHVDDDTLARKIVEKYPVYASKVEFASPDYFSKENAKNVVSDVARPVLEMGGAVAGGAMGLASPVPGGAAMGGAGGYAIGKSAADLLDRGLGVKQPLRSLPEAALETGQDVNAGMQAEFLGQGIAKAVPPAVEGSLGLIKKGANKVLPSVFKTTAGIPEKATDIVLNKPELLNRSKISDEQLNEAAMPVLDGIRQAKERVGQIFGKVFKKYTGLENPIDEFISDTPGYKAITKQRSYQEPGTSETTYTNVPNGREESTFETSFRKAGNGYTGEPVRDPISGAISYVDSRPGQGMVGETREIPGKERFTVIGKTRDIPGETKAYNEVVDTQASRDSSPTLDNLKQDYESAKDGTLFKKKTLGGGTEPLTNQEKLQKLTLLKRSLQAEESNNLNAVTLKPINTVKDAAIKKMASEVDDIRSTLPNGKRLAIMDDAWSEIRDIYAKVQKDFSDPGKGRDTLMRIMRGESNWMPQGRNSVKINAIKRAEQLTGHELLKPAMEELAAALYQSPTGFGIKPALALAPGLSSAATLLVTGHPVAAAGVAATALSTSPKVLSLGLRGAGVTANAAKATGRVLSNSRLGLAAAIRSKAEHRQQ